MEEDKVERFQRLLEEDLTDPEIQYQLALCYLHGEGVAADREEAIKALERASESGYEEATALLSSLKDTKQIEHTGITKETLPEWCDAAEEGDPQAQYLVAKYLMEHEVVGGQRDASRYLEQAVETGHPEACMLLAQEKLRSAEVATRVEGMKLLKNAADCGVPHAAWQLGECYSEGVDGKQDFQQAQFYFEQGAQHEGASLMLELAIRLFWGRGVEQSPAQAMSWVKKAQDAGMEDARQRFEWHIELEKSLNEIDKEEERRRQEEIDKQKQQNRMIETVQTLLKTEPKSPEQQYQLGMYYRTGQGVEMDEEKALQWLRQSALQGYQPAMEQVSFLSDTLPAFSEDVLPEWCDAAEQGDAHAQCQVGIYFLAKVETEEEGVYYLQLAAQQKYSEACLHLGCYYLDQLTIANEQKGVELLLTAANSGSVEAKKELGSCYGQGRGVEKNLEKAEEWLTQWANESDSMAKVEFAVKLSLGCGINENKVKAYSWVKKAQDEGMADARQKYEWMLEQEQRAIDQKKQEETERVRWAEQEIQKDDQAWELEKVQIQKEDEERKKKAQERKKKEAEQLEKERMEQVEKGIGIIGWLVSLVQMYLTCIIWERNEGIIWFLIGWAALMIVDMMLPNLFFRDTTPIQVIRAIVARPIRVVCQVVLLIHGILMFGDAFVEPLICVVVVLLLLGKEWKGSKK